MSTKETLIFNLVGPFSIVTREGLDVTPSSAKMQGLLSTLCLSPNGQRTRVWIQDLLWSDRSPSQASASLRQDLSDMRKKYPDLHSVIEIDRKVVKLLLDEIEVISDRTAAVGHNSEEFLEGIRVRDPAFRVWLEDRRRHWANDPAAAVSDQFKGSHTQKLAISSIQGSPELQFLNNHFIDLISQQVKERTSIEITEGFESAEDSYLSLSTDSFVAKEAGGIRLKLKDQRASKTNWSAMRDFKLIGAIPSEDVSMLQLAHEALDQITQSFEMNWRKGVGPLDSTVLCELGIRLLFTFEEDKQNESDRMFQMAFEADPKAVYLAWRVMARVIKLVELNPDDASQIEEEIQALAAQALELDPWNSMVLAAASNASMLATVDMMRARELADRSVQANLANPFAWDCQSIWHLMAGKFEQAHKLQLKAGYIGAKSRHKHWWDMGCALTATVTGRFDEARRFAENAAALVPNFRPPMRYLMILYASEDRMEDATAIKDRLSKVEIGFDPMRLIEDPNYPVAALRRSTLANRDLVRRFG